MQSASTPRGTHIACSVTLLFPQLGNQDSRRVASRFGPQLVDALNMLSLVLPGPSFTYYGEEIGMKDALVSPDPQDVGRSPFQWDNSISAGTFFRIHHNVIVILHARVQICVYLYPVLPQILLPVYETLCSLFLHAVYGCGFD